MLWCLIITILQSLALFWHLSSILSVFEYVTLSNIISIYKLYNTSKRNLALGYIVEALYPLHFAWTSSWMCRFFNKFV